MPRSYEVNKRVERISNVSVVTVDYVKEKDGRFIASNIVVTVKSQGRR